MIESISESLDERDQTINAQTDQLFDTEKGAIMIQDVDESEDDDEDEM